jgi:signal transduction histidine kinase/CheY-like chemotaxis protein
MSRAATTSPQEPAAGIAEVPLQRVVKLRRDYNGWVARETMEDYALRFTPRRFRKWSEWRVANTAFGAAAFLVLEAVGATLLVQYGFVNAFWAIVATGALIFAAGLPISVYAARYGVDMDLLTRGAGFGYLGSTLTSLIYAAFTFIFFALEAAVMAYALELAFDIPPAWGYVLCALVVIPLVTHGVSTISRLQVWTQPLWLAMLVLPFVAVFVHKPEVLGGLVHYAGDDGRGQGFQLHLFGAALTVGVALITQMGEQVDYLRFMPEKTRATRWRWWAAVVAGGPGWVLPGVAKMLGGALLAYLAITLAVPVERAVDPNQMYLAAYNFLFPHYGWAVAATATFVVVSQLKINVTNAYAGSLAWSNFFSRLTHSHPGRVVWMVFNIGIALALMEMNVFSAIGAVLGLFSNVAIAWMMGVVADLVINKPLGLSPPGIEFRRAYLYDINPVGVGAMLTATLLAVAAHMGLFGPLAQAFSALIAMVTALVMSPLIAWATRGRYYLARTPPAAAARAEGEAAAPPTSRCSVCERSYEAPDMAHCPAYRDSICSLCCTLDARCQDLCKPQARAGHQLHGWAARLLPARLAATLGAGLGHYLLLMLAVTPLLAGVFGILYQQEIKGLSDSAEWVAQPLRQALAAGYLKAFAALWLLAGLVCWWLVLAHQSRAVAQEESNRQTALLMQEIDSHRRTDLALQRTTQLAEQARRDADAANRAKSRYISSISHELRTPLNSVLGYAQLLHEDAALPPQHRHAVRVIRRGGEHLLSLIEGTLDIARIESGKLRLEVRPMAFAAALDEIAQLFALQARAKGLAFHFEPQGRLPAAVRADERRLRQILINLLGNAVKFTQAGQVTLRVRHAREIALFEVEDSGCGIAADEQPTIFEPFVRGRGARSMLAAGDAAADNGTGLGLTIAKMLTDLMGGELSLRSAPGQGSTFSVRLYLPSVAASSLGTEPRHEPHERRPSPAAASGSGGNATAAADLPGAVPGALPVDGAQAAPRTAAGAPVLVVDNERADRELLAAWLEGCGLRVTLAADGEQALTLLRAGLAPRAIFMDLAMPGLDGWQTLGRIDAERLAPGAAVAIASANAFERTLDQAPPGLAIGARDYLLKPIRQSALRDWLRQRGLLEAGTAAAPSAAPVAAGASALASADPQALAGLRHALDLGYLRGVLQALDAIESAAGAQSAAAALEPLRELARGFRFDALRALLPPPSAAAAAGAHE